MTIDKLRPRVFLSHEISGEEYIKADAQEVIEECETWRERGHIERHHGRQNQVYRNLFPYVYKLGFKG